MRLIGLSVLGISLVFFLLNACTAPRSALEQVIRKGELRVVTRQGPTTLYDGTHGRSGLEYELVSRFAEHLGVRVTFLTPDSYGDIFTLLNDGDAQFAAAGLAITAARQAEFRFTPPYQQISPQLIYNSTQRPRPRELNELLAGKLEVTAKTSHSERLQYLKQQGSTIAWIENPDTDTGELLDHVADGLLDYTVADSNVFAYYHRYYPELQAAFSINEPESLAWAFPKGNDDSLYNEAVAFFKQLSSTNELDKILAHNYQHVENYDYRGTHTFLTQIQQRLPLYREQFEISAKRYAIDWRLLAAIAYQESHWRPEATSPTGVRGMMMLTQATADDLGVEARTDVEESIAGGARYLRALIDKIPDRIPEPDRTWLALAAYNIGFGHLEDARILTQKNAENPDKWLEVKAYLPLLGKRKWYKDTRYGFARGYEPVRYVDNIRSYYDILVWYLEREDTERFKTSVAGSNLHSL
ncbi:MAG: membrane-bound lytic murein transglycosylase MltF [Gammaproteobacteria bacterium]|nr:membrane-bound lytic murein transglycosylase MltF [Gammaproteobacteria bacterium]